jgi:trk system potassium uptake protein
MTTDMAKRSFAVIGLGRFGSAIATTLASLGQEVVGIDRSEEKVRQISDILTHAVELDATDEKALRATGIHEVDLAVVSIGEDIEASVLIVMTLKELGVPTVIAKATTGLHGRILEKLGVSRVIFPEREMASRIGHSLVVPNALDYIELSPEFSIIELPAPPPFVGQTLRELQLRPKYGLTLIAIKRRAAGAQRTDIAPSAEDVIHEGDVLALLGSNTRLGELERILVRSR